MNLEILKLKASNLPVYTYSLNAKIVLCWPRLKDEIIGKILIESAGYL